MIASLPMYDLRGVQAANDRFWALIQTGLGHGPLALSRDLDLHESWLRDDLLLSQTCGLPFRTELRDRVRYVGTPDYGVAGCTAGYYRSVIVVRGDDSRQRLEDFSGALLARNDVRSQSGWAAVAEQLLDSGARLPQAHEILDTGAHLASAMAVAEGRADFAALDAVTWRLLQQAGVIGQHLRVLTQTRPTPGLPFITALANDPAPIFDAIQHAIAGLEPADRDALGIKGLTWIDPHIYYREPLPAPLP